MTGIELISKERQEQIEKHGISIEMDRGNANGELLQCARYLLSGMSADFPRRWNKDFKYKIDGKSNIEKITISAALLAAELDRLNNL